MNQEQLLPSKNSQHRLSIHSFIVDYPIFYRLLASNNYSSAFGRPTIMATPPRNFLPNPSMTGVPGNPNPEPLPNSPRLSYAYPLINGPPPPPIPNHLPGVGNSLEPNGIQQPTGGLPQPIPTYLPELENSFEPNGIVESIGEIHPPIPEHMPGLRNSFESNGTIERPTSGLQAPLPPWPNRRLEKTGSCFCGAIRLRVYGRPVHTYLCEILVNPFFHTRAKTT
ncbi:hypothetical protein M434DRAFT_200388 [Hypoxylon sp. CO27-5]|nr:hypothetical protein M434DRAFT_200388 [Hypoxylon sp. CO27-5]